MSRPELSQPVAGPADPYPLRTDQGVFLIEGVASKAMGLEQHDLRVTPPSQHVGHVVSPGTEVEVVRPGALRVVAAMEDAQVTGWYPIPEFPCQSVGFVHSTTEAEDAVPLAVPSELPFPATIAHQDVVPENLGVDRLSDSPSHRCPNRIAIMYMERDAQNR